MADQAYKGFWEHLVEPWLEDLIGTTALSLVYLFVVLVTIGVAYRLLMAVHYYDAVRLDSIHSAVKSPRGGERRRRQKTGWWYRNPYP